MKRLTARRGATLVMVLTAIFVALALWSASYDRIRHLIVMQERLVKGYSKVPDVGDALAWATACMKVGQPAPLFQATPVSPYRCRKKLGRTDALAVPPLLEQNFRLTYTKTGSNTYSVLIDPILATDTTDPLCPECPSAGGP